MPRVIPSAPHGIPVRAMFAAIALAAGSYACGGASVAPTPEPIRQPMREAGVDCAAMRALADSAPATASSDTTYFPPQPTALYVPDPALLRKVHGRVTYTVPVDTSGSPELAGARVSGLSDPNARRELEQLMAKVSYRPAFLHGCPVRGISIVSFTSP